MISKHIKVVVGLICLLIPLTGNGQTLLQQAYDQLSPGATLPENILASRTAVFLNLPPQTNEQHPLHWKPVANTLHSALVGLKIDAVAYYSWQELNSGIDASASFFEVLKGRNIEQVIILSFNQGRYDLYIVPTKDHDMFLDPEAPNWHLAGADLQGVLTQLSDKIKSTGPELANFLVVEQPEFFNDTRMFRSNRFETYQPDLKLDKLAVPLLVTENPEELSNPDNLNLQQVMSAYPFRYELVDYKRGEELLKRAGFQYILLSLYAPESSVRALLDYQSTGDEGRMVYKFYIRHLNSGDIYLGDTWDASASYETALQNHIDHLKVALKVN